MNKSWKAIALIGFSIAIISGCSLNTTTNEEQKNSQENLPASNTNNPSPSDAENNESTSLSMIEQTKDIKYIVAGEEKTTPGNLYMSQDQNFYMYLLPEYGANSDKVKGTDVIWNADSDDESIRIKNYGKQDQQPLVDKSKEELKSNFGNVEENFTKRNNKFYQNAVILQAENETQKLIVIVIPINGEMFGIQIQHNKKMQNDEHLFAMVQTIKPLHD